jgi:flagellar assembly factor FliW
MSKVHGEIVYQEKNIVTFNKEIPGFIGLKKFILKDLEEYEPFKLLQSLENDELGFILTSPFDVFEKYEIKLSDELIRNLEIKSEKEVLVLTTLTLNTDVKEITTNLKGPIIINTSTNLGEQIIVDNPNYLIKYPLIKE